MTTRSLSIAAAAGGLAVVAWLPGPASALPGVAGSNVQSNLVYHVGSKYRRHYDPNTGTYVRAPFTEVDTHRGTWVAAPFARVYSGRHGTWVRAPFVNLWVPR